MFERLCRTTFFFIAGAIIFGILLEKFFEVDPNNLLFVAVVLFVLTLLITAIHLKKKLLYLRNTCCFLFLLVVVASTYVNASKSHTELLPVYGRAFICGHVETITKRDSVGTKFRFQADTITFTDCKYLNRRGVVTLKNTDQRIDAGDYLRFNVYIWEPDVYNGFDYPKYLRETHLEFVGTAYSCKFDLTKKNENFFYDIREMLIDSLSTNGISPQNLSLLQALFLGDRTEIDSQTRQTFNTCGIGHVLAVSGLHVGIIWGIFTLIFSFFKGRSRKFDIALQFFLIALLWFYAGITGFAIPIIRATTMVTALIFVGMMQYKTNNYNTLFLVLTIFLISDPDSLFSIGLQMSFIAVLALMGYARLTNIHQESITILQKIKKYVYELFLATIVVQIIISPLILYYFHYFPTYFIINNPVILPLLTLILFFAILTLVLSFIPYLYNIFGFITDSLMNFLNSFIEKTSQLPYSQLNFSIDGFSCIILLLMFVLIGFIINEKKFLSLND